MLPLIGAIIAILVSAYFVYRMERYSNCSKRLFEQVIKETKDVKSEIDTLASVVAVDCTEDLEANLKLINQQINSIRSAPIEREPKNVRRKKGTKRNKPLI